MTSAIADTAGTTSDDSTSEGEQAEVAAHQRPTEVLSNNRRMKFDPSLRMYFSPPDSHRIHEMIMNAADRQIQTTQEARAIVAAGLWSELRALVHAISGNASCAIASEFDHYLELDADGSGEG